MIIVFVYSRKKSGTVLFLSRVICDPPVLTPTLNVRGPGTVSFGGMGDLHEEIAKQIINLSSQTRF